MPSDAREELLRFLDRRAFDPILHAAAPDLSDSERHQLEDVKGRTQQQQRRYHDDYRSASEIRTRFLDDLGSRAAARVNTQLRHLHLPHLPDLKDEFVALCERLGVS